ncbi:MAG: hypothetical protein AUJ72_04790 [Candidatus Omnitrophica bacterium CG1_02_46_14]|nr:MAG: hypothetical protein AUJ72_04790 [Candidatus Omnitrophica bacterium CG1_02_46_14]
MKKILFEDALILKAVKILRALAQALPLKVSFALARGVGTVIFYLSKRRTIAYRNLRAGFAGEMSCAKMKRIARSSMQKLAMSSVELLRFPEIDEAYIRKNIRILGGEKIDRELKAGKGAIFLTAHFGCWELLNLTSNLVGYPMVVLTRTQKHPRSNEFLNSLRASKGNQIIRKGMPVREILKALKRGKIVGMLSDQDGGKNGTFVQFFNRSSSSPSGVATFALRTNAPIFPVFIFREDNEKHRVEVGDPLHRPADGSSPEAAERELLQQFAKILESNIRRAPDQWLWAHRRWKSTPNRSILILSDGKPGHLNQSMAFLKAIREERHLQGILSEHTVFRTIEIEFKNKFLKDLLNLLMRLCRGYLPFKTWFLQYVLSPASFHEIDQVYADVVISCGSSLLGINLLVKAYNQAKSVVIMKPAFAVSRFDAVIVPRHDKMQKRSNVFVTETVLVSSDENGLRAESSRLLEKIKLSNGLPKIGLLVGGDTPQVKFRKEHFKRILREAQRYCVEKGAVILATSSRRTPLWADDFMKRELKGSAQCPFLVIANESNPKGTVPGILGASDVLMVSGESMSMVSEAIASGKPVIVFDPSDEANLKSKHEEFLQRMSEKEMIVRACPETLYESMRLQLNSKNKRANTAYLNDLEVLKLAVRRVI